MRSTLALQRRFSTRHVVSLLAASCALSVPAARAGATPATWVAPASGSWIDPSNWSTNPLFPNNGNPPGATYDVTIAAAGATYEVVLDATLVPGGDVAVDSLAVNAGAARLRLAGGNLRSAGLLDLGAGTVAVDGAGTIAAQHVRVTGGTFDLDGELNATTLSIAAAAGAATFTHRGGITAHNIVLGPAGHFENMALTFPGLLLFDDFHQTGGTARHSQFWAGVQERPQTYRIDDGSFDVNSGMYVGRGNDGTFVQAGGHVRVSALLNIGVFAGTGRYHLSGGSLESFTQVVGDRSPGAFMQTGGTNLGNVTIAREDNGPGTYTLSAGTLHAPAALRVGERAAGTFVQSGGYVRIDNSDAEFALAVGFGGTGVYDLSGGSLIVGSSARGAVVGFGTNHAGTFNLSGNAAMLADRITIGYGGAGTFIQSGGTFSAAWVQLGGDTQGAGRYVMSGGLLFPNALSVGDGVVGGNGTFAQSGGIVNVTNGVALARTPQSRGHYALSDGLLVTPTLTVAEAGPASVAQTGGTASVGTLLISGNAPAVGSYLLGGGTLLVPGALRVDGPGSLSYAAGRLNVGTLALRDDARLLTSTGVDKVIRVRSLDLSGDDWTIDLADNAMVIDYGGASPVAAVRQWLAAAYGAWNAGGLTSSSAAGASTSARATGIGYAEATDLFAQFPAEFAGEPVDATTVLLKYTLYGDANLDGVVNLRDFNILAANFGQTGRRWSQGDFTYGGAVTLTDFNLLAANFGYAAAGANVTPQDWANLAALAPEPGGTAGGAPLLATAVCARRRARQRKPD